jgi:hypothetical protein
LHACLATRTQPPFRPNRSAPALPQIDVHVDSSIIASQITKLCRSNTKRLVCDIGLLIQGESPGELPEIMVGAFQMRYPDCDFAQLPEELVPGGHKRSHQQSEASESRAKWAQAQKRFVT